MAAEPRRRGVVPNDLRQRLDRATPDFTLRMAARVIAGSLDGVAPHLLSTEERGQLDEIWGELGSRALTALEQVGYGAPAARRPRSERAHGLRRERRLRGVLGKLPRSLALRLPTTAETHRPADARNDGRDRWGEMRCSRTLRADHLGVLAAVGGLWAARAADGETHVDCTAGELVQLLDGGRRIGGKQIARVHQLLADLEQLQISGQVNQGKDGEASTAHEIPGAPLTSIQRRLGDRWLAANDYLAASRAGADEDVLELHLSEHAPCEGTATIRIHLAQWMIADLTHPKRRPVFIDFTVWAHLRPSARRLYAFVQGLGRDTYDGRIYFYLAAPTLYTLGITTKRLDRAGNAVSEDLTALWHADRRYHDGDGFRRHTHGQTRIPAFGCDAARQPSRPTDRAAVARAPARRPTALRGAIGRLRQHAITGRRDVADGQLDPEAVRRLGLESARAEQQRVRDAIQLSLVSAAATSREPGPFEPSRAALHRRQARNADDDPAD
jgi:hypothetical protein